MCKRWALAVCRPPPLRVRVLHRLLRCQGPDVDGVYAARAAVVTPGGHERALAFLDELIELSADPGRVIDAPRRRGDRRQPVIAE
jgi:hypothetical protein